MNKVILITPVIVILLGITTSTLTTAVQARTGDGFNDGYAKAKYDFTNNLPYNDKCSPNSVYCQHYDAGYKTAWIQEHWNTGTPNNMQLLTVNKTA
jgi:hypothetical protein